MRATRILEQHIAHFDLHSFAPLIREPIIRYQAEQSYRLERKQRITAFDILVDEMCTCDDVYKTLEVTRGKK
jgi:hypothetical protein